MYKNFVRQGLSSVCPLKQGSRVHFWAGQVLLYGIHENDSRQRGPRVSSALQTVMEWRGGYYYHIPEVLSLIQVKV
jgi:hypothetical protein